MHGLVYVLQVVRPDIGKLLEFDRARILSGEVWRVVTFLFSSSGFAGTGMIGILFFFFMEIVVSSSPLGIVFLFTASLFFGKVASSQV